MTQTCVRLFVVCAALLLAWAAAPEPPKVEPVATVTQLMQALIAPSSNALFDVARQAPADDQQWAAVRNNAVILAESGYRPSACATFTA